MVYQKILCNFHIQVVLIKFKGTFLNILDESPLSSIRMSFNFYQNVPVYENYKGFSDKLSYNRPTSILRDTLPLDMLTPQIRHYELWQKNSRYANFSDLSTPSYAIF